MNRMKRGQGLGRKILMIVLAMTFAGFIPAKADPPNTVQAEKVGVQAKTNSRKKVVVLVVRHRHRRFLELMVHRHHRRHQRRVLILRIRRLRWRLHHLKHHDGASNT